MVEVQGGGIVAPPPFASIDAAIEQERLPVRVPVTEAPEPEPEHTHNEPVSAPEPEENNTGGDVWYELAVCESGMYGEPRWDYNGGSGFDGGIQFHPGTWSSFKYDDYPEYAWQATPAQQIQIGREVARVQGAGAWPSCTARLGISTEDLLQ